MPDCGNCASCPNKCVSKIDWTIMDWEECDNSPKLCHKKPSKRSSANCERPIDHTDFHAGRTTSGRWKFWND
jgi:hypothetical protein